MLVCVYSNKLNWNTVSKNKNIYRVKIYTASILLHQNLISHKDTEPNVIHRIELHGAESAHPINGYST